MKTLRNAFNFTLATGMAMLAWYVLFITAGGFQS